MHKTAAGERRKALKRDAQGLARDAKNLQKVAKHLPAARLEAQRLQGEADVALVEAEALKLQAKLEDLTVWDMKKINQSRRALRPTCTGWPHGARATGRAMSI